MLLLPLAAQRRIIILRSLLHTTARTLNQNYYLHHRPSVLAPVVLGRRVLLLCNPRRLVLGQLLLGPLAQLLDTVDRARYPAHLVRNLAAPDQGDDDARTDNKRQNESVLTVCGRKRRQLRLGSLGELGYLHQGGVQPRMVARVST